MKTETTRKYTQTSDGWSVELDYGKDGVSRGVVHMVPATAEERERNRKNLEAFFARYGYKLQ